MDDQFEYVNCIICGKDDTEVFIRSTGPAQVVRCRNDGLIYRNPRYTNTRIREFYGQYVRDDNVEWFVSARQAVLRREAEVIMKVKSDGNLLDVGCGAGVFFEHFPKNKWNLYGVEISARGAEIAKERYGADVFVGTLSEAHYPFGFFDVVTVLDALFCFPDPKSELIEIRRILKDDGLLVVEIPGLTYQLVRERGLLCWLLDGKWTRAFAYPWHLYHFSPATLVLLLNAVGFKVIDIAPEQASLRRQGFSNVLNKLHFALARLLFRITGGRFSLAGKELYLATKVK